MQFTQIIASLALVGSIQARFHNTTGGAVSNSTGGAASNSTGGAGSNSTGGAGSNFTGGAGGQKSDNAANANANIYGGAALVAAAVALLY